MSSITVVEELRALEAALGKASSEQEKLAIALRMVEAQKQRIKEIEASERAVADATVRMAELFMELEDAQEMVTQQKAEILQQNEELNASLDQIKMVNEHLEELNALNHNLQIESEEAANIRKAHHLVMSSINYSKRIQFSLLPDVKDIKSVYPGFFSLYLPKDIVSGDFYWFHHTPHANVLVAADCTGHGVAGAFMMLLGHNLLDRLVCHWCIYEPSELLYELDRELKVLLKQDLNDEVRDSMELTVFVDDLMHDKIRIAGAKRPFVRFRNGHMMVEKGDKFPVGDAYYQNKSFHTYTLDKEPKDRFYFFSDGICDQFGGEKSSKLGTKNFINYLSELQKMPMGLQQFNIQKFFQQWKGKEAQLDDVMVLGLEIP